LQARENARAESDYDLLLRNIGRACARPMFLSEPEQPNLCASVPGNQAANGDPMIMTDPM